MSENKINRIKEYCKENIKENKKDKLQVIGEINDKKILKKWYKSCNANMEKWKYKSS